MSWEVAQICCEWDYQHCVRFIVLIAGVERDYHNRTRGFIGRVRGVFYEPYRSATWTWFLGSQALPIRVGQLGLCKLAPRVLRFALFR